MMNLFLSLCIMASIFAGAVCPLPAVPETATTAVIRDISVEINGESVTLNPEFELIGAVGSEMAALRFEIQNGDQTLMPVAGEITADGVRFTLKDSGRIYTLSEDMLLDMMEMDEESRDMIETIGDVYMQMADLYQRVFSGETMDPARAEAMNQLMAQSLNAAVEETEMEIDGETLDGVRWVADADFAAFLSCADALLECGDPLMEGMFGAILDLYRVIGELEEMEVNAFSDFAGMAPEMDMDMDYSWAASEDKAYQQMTMEMQMPDGSMEMLYEVEQTIRGDVADMNISCTMGVPEAGMLMGMNVNGQIAGPQMAPTMVNLAFDMEVGAEIPTAMSAMEGEAVVYPLMYISGSLLHDDADGQKNTQLAMDITASGEDGPMINVETMENGAVVMSGDVDEGATDTAVSLLMSRNEAATDAGAVGSCAMQMSVAAADTEPVSMALDFNYAVGQVPAAEIIFGDQELAITDDPTGEAYSMLSIDGLGIVADVSALSVEQSLMDMAELMENQLADDAYEDYEVEYTSQSVSTMEEAAAIYSGVIPAYTPPEGYELESITVDAYMMDAYYTNGEQTINYYMYDAGEESVYLLQEDGTLTPMQQPMVTMDVYEDEVSGANVTMDGRKLYFMFSPSLDRAGAEAAIAGLMK